MSNQKLIAALPLAALAAALCHPPHAAAQEGSMVARDRETGQLRAPTPEEVKALRAHPTAKMMAGARPMLVTDPDGKRHATLGPARRVFDVVRRDADGKLQRQCLQGEDAAREAVTQGTTNQAGERSHEIR